MNSVNFVNYVNYVNSQNSQNSYYVVSFTVIVIANGKLYQLIVSMHLSYTRKQNSKSDRFQRSLGKGFFFINMKFHYHLRAIFTSIVKKNEKGYKNREKQVCDIHCQLDPVFFFIVNILFFIINTFFFIINTLFFIINKPLVPSLRLTDKICNSDQVHSGLTCVWVLIYKNQTFCER